MTQTEETGAEPGLSRIQVSRLLNRTPARLRTGLPGE